MGQPASTTVSNILLGKSLLKGPLSAQPISIIKAKLLVPSSEMRSNLEVQIKEGEETAKRPVASWNELEHFKAESRVWADFSYELLLSAFGSAEIAKGFLTVMESSRSSGSLGEWTWEAKHSLTRGIANLRSVQRRLALMRDVHPRNAGSGSSDLVSRGTQLDASDLIEKIQTLKTILIDHVTGNLREDREYRTLRDEIRSHKELSPFLPQIFRELTDLGSAWDYLKRFKHYAERRTYIRSEFQPVVTFLEENAAHTTAPQKFFSAGTSHDAYVEIRSILKTAKNEIVIVDSWVDETLWSLLKNLSNAVSVRILTTNAKGDFALEKTKFCKQYKASVEARVAKSYHDRFILADRQRCWHLGASIKDAGTKACLISEILSHELVSAVILDVEQAWQQATALI